MTDTTAPDTVATLAPKLAMLAHRDVLTEIATERAHQDAKWGEQNHPDGTGGFQEEMDAHNAKVNCDRAAEAGCVEWRHFLAEEVAEAFAAVGPELRTELLQVAAVAVAWVEAIDRRAQND